MNSGAFSWNLTSALGHRSTGWLGETEELPLYPIHTRGSSTARYETSISAAVQHMQYPLILTSPVVRPDSKDSPDSSGDPS